MIQTAKRSLVKQCNNNPTTWVNKISGIRAAMNDTPSETTGHSPHFILHGMERRTIAEAKKIKSVLSEVDQRLEEVRSNSDMAKMKQMENYNKHPNFTEYHVGDAVMVKNFAKNSMFDKTY